METIRSIPPSTAAPIYPYQEPDSGTVSVAYSELGPIPVEPIKVNLNLRIDIEQKRVPATRPEEV